MTTSASPVRAALQSIVAGWTVYTAAASLSVYVIGYLSVRFQLAALGLASDLQLIDERYLFEGAKVAVYYLCAAPVAALLVLPIALVLWGITRISHVSDGQPGRHRTRSTFLIAAALVISTLAIQLTMRHCFRYDNLLLRESLPAPAWLTRTLLSTDETVLQFYLAGLLVVTLLCALPLLLVRNWDSVPPAGRVLAAVLGVFVVVQAVLLPINHGILVGTRWFARLADDPLTAPGAARWLVWEGKEQITVLRVDAAGRRLTAHARKEFGDLTITGYDPLAVVRSHVPVTEAIQPPPARTPSPDDAPVQRAATDSSARPTPPAPPRLPSTVQLFWKELVVTLGLDTSAGRQRAGPALPEPVNGDLAIISSTGGPARVLTSGGGFRSPIFSHDGNSLLALRGDTIIKLDISSGELQVLAESKRIRKLVAIDPRDPNACYAIVDESDGGVSGAAIDTSTGTVSLVAPADIDEDALAWLRAEDRGSQLRISVRQESNAVLPNKWTDLWAQSGSDPPRRLTTGNGRSSRQPALSPDGRQIAFVRSGG